MFQACRYYTPTKPENQPREIRRKSEQPLLHPSMGVVTIAPAQIA
jgi:hypothetical protein